MLAWFAKGNIPSKTAWEAPGLAIGGASLTTAQWPLMRRTHARARLLAVCLTLLCVGLPAELRAQLDPNMEGGTFGRSVFTDGSIDAINLFNGNLTLQIALSQAYPVAEGLSYSFGLTYNSGMWRPDGGGGWLTPTRDFNAGLGWVINLPRLIPQPGMETIYTLVDGTGSRHTFYRTLHEGDTESPNIRYTRDGSYLRLNVNVAPNTVETPDGLVMEFSYFWPFPEPRLTKLRDRFGNWVNYTYQATSQSGPETWTISDSVGREHTISVTHPSPGLGQCQVTSLNLEAFTGGGPAGSKRLYCELSYLDTSVSIPGLGMQVTVPLLASVSWKKDNASGVELQRYEMAEATTPWYHTQDGAKTASVSGRLFKTRLAEGGMIFWEYDDYSFPERGSGIPSTVAGVSKRKTLSPTGADVATWHFTPRTVEPPADPDLKAYNETNVHSPAGSCVAHFFATPHSPGAGDPPANAWRYGLPMRLDATATYSGRTVYLSQRLFPSADSASHYCTGSGIRSQFVEYEIDVAPEGNEWESQLNTNPRLTDAWTVFHDDGQKATGLWFDASTYDGFGHFRTVEERSSGFSDAFVRSSTTNYNPSAGTYVVNRDTNTLLHGLLWVPDPADPWVLNTFDYQSTTIGSSSVRRDFCFTAQGALRSVRTRTAAAATSGTDLLTVFTRNSAGWPTTTQYFGGDDTSHPIPSDHCTSTNVLANAAMTVESTYANGALETSRPSVAGETFYWTNNVVDRSGLVYQTHARSVGTRGQPGYDAGIVTTFDFDAFGRLTQASPASGHGACTTVTYTPWSAGNATKIESVALPNGCSGSPITSSAVHLDSFGRPIKELRLLPPTSCSSPPCFSQRTNEYNGWGWQTAMSEWQLQDPSTVKKTTFGGFDHLGRPTTITPPDGTAHNVALAYSGVRSVSRTVKLATSQTAETGSTTTWEYDSLGRLAKVVEPSSSTGQATTTYAYDAGGNLTTATTQASVSGVTRTQTRQFAYDGRGFLTSETLPEKTGAVSYPRFDALGNALRQEDGGIRWKMGFDGAGRLTSVDEANFDTDWTSKRSLQSLTYAATGTAANRSNGQLATATNHNWTSEATDVPVIESYTYGGTGGRISEKSTSIGGAETLAQAFTWDALGQLATETYPQYTGVGPQRTVSFTRTNGALTAVPGFATNLQYHANGMLAGIDHTSGMVLTQENDPSSMQRPFKICTQREAAQATCPATPLSGDWTTNGFAYDGAGNVKGYGTSYFTYDLAGRLTKAVPRGTALNVYQNYAYDGFGNLTEVKTKLYGQSETTRTIATDWATNRLSGVTYSNRGEQTSWGTATYSWYPSGWLAAMTDTGVNEKYLYTASGERIVTIDGLASSWRVTVRGLDGKVRRVYSRGSDGTWMWDEDYVYRDGILLATVDPVAGTKHVHVDHLGTVRYLTTGCRSSGGYRAYFGFGEQADPDSSLESEAMQFTGHERDVHGSVGSTDDLDYMHARYYNPNIGRFLSPDLLRGDPGKPKTFNLFSYVSGNPMTYTDPFGLQSSDNDLPPPELPRYLVFLWVWGDSFRGTFGGGGTEVGPSATPQGVEIPWPDPVGYPPSPLPPPDPICLYFQLFKQGQSGRSPYEFAAWETWFRHQSALSTEGWTTGFHQAKFIGIVPPGMIRQVHTHPWTSTPWPSPTDKRNSLRFSTPFSIRTVHPLGIWEWQPSMDSGAKGVEVFGEGWAENARKACT